MSTWSEEESRDAMAARTVRALTEMPAGTDEILGHLFIGPKTLADLHDLVLARRRRNEPEERDAVHVRMVVHSLLYDVGRLAVENIIECNEEGMIQVAPERREGVRLYMATLLRPISRARERGRLDRH